MLQNQIQVILNGMRRKTRSWVNRWTSKGMEGSQGLGHHHFCFFLIQPVWIQSKMWMARTAVPLIALLLFFFSVSSKVIKLLRQIWKVLSVLFSHKIFVLFSFYWRIKSFWTFLNFKIMLQRTALYNLEPEWLHSLNSAFNGLIALSPCGFQNQKSSVI